MSSGVELSLMMNSVPLCASFIALVLLCHALGAQPTEAARRQLYEFIKVECDSEKLERAIQNDAIIMAFNEAADQARLQGSGKGIGRVDRSTRAWAMAYCDGGLR